MKLEKLADPETIRSSAQLPSAISEQLTRERIDLCDFTDLCSVVGKFFKEVGSNGLDLLALVERCRSEVNSNTPLPNSLLEEWFSPRQNYKDSALDDLDEEMRLEHVAVCAILDHEAQARASLIIQYLEESKQVVKIIGFRSACYVDMEFSDWWNFTSSTDSRKSVEDLDESNTVVLWRSTEGQLNTELLGNLNCSLLSHITRLPGIDHNMLLCAFPALISGELIHLTDALQFSDLIRIRHVPKAEVSAALEFQRIYFPNSSSI